MDPLPNNTITRKNPEAPVLWAKKYSGSRVFAGELTVHFRPIRPEDASLLEEFFHSHSEQTIMHRYLAHVRELSAGQVRRFVTLDYWNEFALAGFLRTENQECMRERMIGIARYSRGPTEEKAEMAVVVHDELQGRGIGTFLVKKLMEIAAENGIKYFTASVLGDNHVMMHIFHKLASKMESRLESDVYDVQFSTR